ncbi:SRPBCC domain-containing protein [Mucilaginibacter sp. PAMB04274]|uniref:SRPBCC family protein n=1 Tax=Mucilaginibacter sp. PAMB04274 TaxID=3138568 RepID=UPI0031F5F1DB
MTSQTEPVLEITRILDAPPELVFKAWTEPERLAKWWGPKGSRITIKKFDLKPEGTFHYCMDHPNGTEMWGLFVFHEVSAPRKLVFVSSFADPEGNIIRGPFFSNWPLEIKNVLTLEETDGKTIMTLKGGPINATEDEMAQFAKMTQSMQQGFGGSFNVLEEYLKSIAE